MKTGDFFDELLSRMTNDGLKISISELDKTPGIHRCGTLKKPNSKDGAYQIYTGLCNGAWWQDWNSGIKGRLYSKESNRMSKKEKEELKIMIEENKKLWRQETHERKVQSAQIAEEYWDMANDLPDNKQNHKYLKHKKVNSYGLRVDSEGALLIPAYNQQGEMQGIQRIFWRNGKSEKRNLKNTIMAGAFCPIMSTNGESDPLLIAEGYATGASLHMATGKEVWVTFGAENLLEVTKIAREKYKYRKIVVCADYDPPSKGFPNEGGKGVAKANEAMLSIGNSYLAICPHAGEAKFDFNDLCVQKGFNEVEKTISKILEGKPHNSCAMPEGYKIIKEGENEGLYYKNITEDIRIGSALEVLAHVRTASSEQWGIEVGFKDPDGKYHMKHLTYADIHVKQGWLPILVNSGWRGESRHYDDVQDYLVKAQPSTRITLVEKVGWINNKYYMLGNKIFGETGNEQFRMIQADAMHLYSQKGSYDKWKAYAKLCVGNPFLMFALAVGFAGPVLSLIDGSEGGGFMLYGNSSIGKTTISMLSSSAMGDPNKLVNTWRATVNGVEILAYLHNDNLVIFDELGQVRAEDLEEIIYMLGNGRGKVKSTQDGKKDNTKTWKVIIICTGEVNIAQKLRECGKKKRVGEEVRIIGIRIPDNHICNLHNYDSPFELMEDLKKGILANYGHAGVEFIKQITTPNELERIKGEGEKFINKVVNKLCAPYNATPPILRGAKRFALVAYAAKLAVKYNILPAEFKNKDYIKAVFSAWLADSEFAGPAKDLVILAHVYKFFEDYRKSNFHNFSDPVKITGELYGYTGLNRKNCKPTDFIMKKDKFIKILCEPYDPEAVIRVLKDNNMLRLENKQNKGQTRVTIPGEIQDWKYVITLNKDANKGV